MDTEIPAELFLPTVEELEERTAKDLVIKWKLRNRPGKKERDAIKQEKYAAKLKAIAGELCGQEQQTYAQANNLSSLFVKNEKSKFSLNAINGNNSANVSSRPTLRAALNGTKLVVTEIESVRKRGRPPKLKPI
jgi:superfamily I DNA and/or RNA helicase